MAASHFDSLALDLRYTLRTLRRDPGFATFAVLIIGLGIGASSTLFSVVNTLLLRPLPFREPDRLTWVANHDTAGLSGQTTQVGYIIDLRQRSRSFSDLGAYMAFYGVGDALLIGSGEPERLSAVGRSRKISFRRSALRRRSGACSTRRNASGTAPRRCCWATGCGSGASPPIPESWAARSSSLTD
jgi:hypothetical protein